MALLMPASSAMSCIRAPSRPLSKKTFFAASNIRCSVVHRYIDFVSENPQLPLFMISELTKDPERIKNLLNHTENFSKMQGFAVKLMQAMQAGDIKQVHPLHLILNIIAMCIFPFLAQPMIQNVMKISDEDYALFLSQRKEQVSLFVHAALKA